MHRSPPLIAGSIWSPAKDGSSTSGAGRRAASPKRSVPSAVAEQRGAEPDGQGQPGRGQADRLAGVVGRRVLARRPGRRPGRRPRPAVIRRAAAVQALSISTRSSRLSVVTSKATKCSRSCAGRDDPGLVAAGEGDGVVGPRTATARSSATACPMTPPAAPAASTPAVPAPTSPNSRRRESPAGRSCGSLRTHRPATTAATLLTDSVRAVMLSLRPVQLLLGELVVQGPAVPGAVLLELGLGGGEPLVDLGDQVGVGVLQEGPQRLDGGLRALEVGGEVPQVGVRVAVLLAGDLAGGDLVEQGLRAVGQLQRVEGGLVGQRHDLRDVALQLVGVGAHVGDVAGLPQGLLDPVVAGEVLALGLVALAAVDARVEVAEDLGDRLDPLPVGAGHREQRLGALDVAGLHRVDEGGRLLGQRGGLALHVALVVLRGLGERLVLGQRRGLSGHGQRVADAVADHPRLAGGLVLAGRQLDEQLAAEPGGDVLDLGHDPVALGVDVELGDLAAAVGHLELVGAGLELGGVDVAGVVGGGDGDRCRRPRCRPPSVGAAPAGGGQDGEGERRGARAGRRSRRDMLGVLRV